MSKVPATKKVVNKGKVSTENPVTVNEVKPQITFVKRRLHKYLVENELAGKNSTATKPEAKKDLTEQQKLDASNYTMDGLKEMKTKYPHTNQEQIDYVVNHFVKAHLPKYITRIK